MALPEHGGILRQVLLLHRQQGTDEQDGAVPPRQQPRSSGKTGLRRDPRLRQRLLHRRTAGKLFVQEKTVGEGGPVPRQKQFRPGGSPLRRGPAESDPLRQPFRDSGSAAVDEDEIAAPGEGEQEFGDILLQQRRHRDDRYGSRQFLRMLRSHAPEVPGADNRIERQPILNRRRDEHILVEGARQIPHPAVFGERVDPEQRAAPVRRGGKSLDHMGDHLVRNLFRHTAVRVVAGEKSQPGGRFDFPGSVHARHGHHRVEVPRIAAVAVEPRAVQKPGVVDVVAERIIPAGQFGDMAHPACDGEAGVEVDRRHRGVDRRSDDSGSVEEAERRGVSGNLHTRRKIAAAGLQYRTRELGEELPPELQHSGGGFRNLLRIEGVLVEESSRDSPRLRAEPHSVGEPEVIEPEVAGKSGILAAEKGSDAGSFGDSLRKSRIRFRVGVQHGVAGDEAVRIDRMRLRDFTVAAVFEIGHGKFRAVVEGGSDADRFPAAFGCADLPQNLNQPLQPAVSARRGILAVAERDEIVVAESLRRRILRHRHRIGDPLPIAPLEGVGRVAGVFENFAAVGNPQQDGYPPGPPGQPPPLPEQGPGHPAHLFFTVVQKRLAADLEREIAQLKISVHKNAPFHRLKFHLYLL